jgi:integrase
VPDLVGLRDRVLIATMIYTFARVGAVLQMNVGDYFTQGRRGWVRLHEKGGKEHEAPCHHKLEAFLDEYIAAAGIAGRCGGAAIQNHGAGDEQASSHEPTRRLPDDPEARESHRHQNQDR